MRNVTTIMLLIIAAAGWFMAFYTKPAPVEKRFAPAVAFGPAGYTMHRQEAGNKAKIFVIKGTDTIVFVSCKVNTIPPDTGIDNEFFRTDRTFIK